MDSNNYKFCHSGLQEETRNLYGNIRRWVLDNDGQYTLRHHEEVIVYDDVDGEGRSGKSDYKFDT